MNILCKTAAIAIGSVALLVVSGCTVSSTTYSGKSPVGSATSVSFGVGYYPYYRGSYPRYYRSGVYYRRGYYRRGYYRSSYKGYYRKGYYRRSGVYYRRR